MQMSVKPLLAAAALAVGLSAAPVLAEQVKFTADLKGTSEVPPTDSAGTGMLDATLDTDTKVFTWTVTYDGMSGDAVAAHFHGPAAEGANADVVVPVADPLASPIKGNATLTDDQIGQLQGGMWYFNIHTAKFPDGEIRGQVVKSAM